MEFSIAGNPEYGQLTATLSPGDRFIAEGGAMGWMSEGTKIKARLLGGLLKALVRKTFGGESLFVGEYQHPTGGSVTFSPDRPGTVLERSLHGDSFILTAGSFMACTPGIKLKTKFGGLKAMFSGEGAFFIECSGNGQLFFNAFGAVLEKEVDGSFIVDTGHVVGWEPGLQYSITGMGSLKSTLLSGEGLVMNFSGTGKVYVQTRTISGMAKWLSPLCN